MIPPQFVAPYRKGGVHVKNDSLNAEVTCEASACKIYGAPHFATLIFDGELACLNLFGVVVGTAPPRHDEIRA